MPRMCLKKISIHIYVFLSTQKQDLGKLQKNAQIKFLGFPLK
jgi:hypothetical protein